MRRAQTWTDVLRDELVQRRRRRVSLTRQLNDLRAEALACGIPADLSHRLRLLSRWLAKVAALEARVRMHLYDLTGSAFPEDTAAAGGAP